jgi:hypothetical protein
MTANNANSAMPAIQLLFHRIYSKYFIGDVNFFDCSVHDVVISVGSGIRSVFVITTSLFREVTQPNCFVQNSSTRLFYIRLVNNRLVCKCNIIVETVAKLNERKVVVKKI